MSRDYDVIVVGARVAGAPTAMLLARCGHRVLMVDRAAMPLDTLSTHAVLRSGVLQLTRWGLLDDLIAAGTPQVGEITLGFGADRISFEVRAECGVDRFFAPRRFVLDHLLARAAVEAGAEFLQGARMTDLIREEDGAIAGVVLDADGARRQITAEIVIGADGVSSRVAEKVGARDRLWHEPLNAVHYAYFRGIDASGFWFQFSPGVNAGLVPTNDGECLVFTGRPSRLFDRFAADPEAEFNRLLHQGGEDLAEKVAAGERVSRFRGTRGLRCHLRQAWGPGWALVGDAGYTKDPISAHGMSDALRDAELCARAVDRAVSDPGEAARAMGDYQRQRDALSETMFEESRRLAAYRWEPAEASIRMRAISEAVRDECDALLALPEWRGVPKAVAVA